MKYMFIDFLCLLLYHRQEGAESRIATIVIRGSTDNYMDDIERAVDDAVNTFKGLCKVNIILFVKIHSLFVCRSPEVFKNSLLGFIKVDID